MIELTFQHPHIGTLAAFGDVHSAVLKGHWSVAATISAEKARDLKGQQAALDALAVASGLTFEPEDAAPHVTTVLNGDVLTVRANTEGLISGALDLYMRLLCGQWRELDWMSALNSATDRASAYNPDDIVQIRNGYGRYGQRQHPLAADQWPDHIFAAISIAQSTLPARIAYHAYKFLGGGTPGGPTFSLPSGPLVVRDADGAMIDRIRSYV